MDAYRWPAPWKDFNGNEIKAGDEIEHPDGTEGIVRFDPKGDSPSDQWFVQYGDGVRLRLCNQIGDKGRAVVVSYGAIEQEHQS